MNPERDQTTSNDEPKFDNTELQTAMKKCIVQFRTIDYLIIEDNDFIKMKLEEISEQRKEFMKFVQESITHSHITAIDGDDLIIFAECCDDDNIDTSDLLDVFKKKLSDTKQNQRKSKMLKNQLKRIKINLSHIIELIYEENIRLQIDGMNYQTKLPAQIELQPQLLK